MTDDHGGAESIPDDVDKKLKLIIWSYGEVLDATKHQDDKIGRLLTSIAFLTAATLALAALSSANFVTRQFSVPPVNLPLGLISLAVFLVGMIFTVMLLLTSLATPLRLPGLTEYSGRPPMDWVAGVEASQSYFREISTVALHEWERKWDAPVRELERERLVSLVRETHNLGVRTNAKYDRTTECVALLSSSLLAFALAVVFVATAAGSTPSTEPIRLEAIHRLGIGALLGCYCGLQLLVRIRYAGQTVDETTIGNRPRRLREWLRPRRLRDWLGYERLYAFLLSACVIDVVSYDGTWQPFAAWLIVTIFLVAASLLVFWRVTQSGRTGSRRRRRGLLTLITVVLAASALGCGAQGWYVGQLVVAILAVLGLIVPSILVR